MGWAMGSLLEVRNLTIDYATRGSESFRAVDDLSFHVEAGEVVGLMGESGCGKSSIALALLGLLPRKTAKISGSVFLAGRELLGMNEKELQKLRGSEISLIFQEPEIALSPMMRVGEQIAEVIHAHRRWNWKRCRSEAAQLLERVGLEPAVRIFDSYPHQLSGGQRQRIVLAQAISCKPALLVADEPTASLDVESQNEFISLLRNLRNETGLSILLISHSPALQARLADRLLVIRNGQIIESGSFERLFENPAHDYTRLMLRRKKWPANTTSGHTDLEFEEQFTR